MLNHYCDLICTALYRKGYVSTIDPNIPGVKAMAYSHSNYPRRQGFAVVDDFFLFVDGEYPPFLSINGYLDAYRHFSALVNQQFPTPHVFRFHIPNLAIISFSTANFSPDIIRFARTTRLGPWYGGEVGQVILIVVEKNRFISLAYKGNGRLRDPGILPLRRTAELIRSACQNVTYQKASIADAQTNPS